MSRFYEEIIDELLKKKPKTKDELQRIKIKFCKKHSLKNVPSDADILANVDEDDYPALVCLLKIKPMRTISGVAPVAVMTSPADCPHGRCIYCPGGVRKGTPQSYTGREPAALRAKFNDFDSHRQAKARIEQLETIGHHTDKIDLIVMGGTFPAREMQYQDDFIKGCFDAMNGFVSPSLQESLKLNEESKHRCIGMTIETRPDWSKEAHIDRMLEQGCTRVELGVQTTIDSVLKFVERGHNVSDTIEATQLSKDSGLKVGYHMMPFLPNTTNDEDLENFRTIFEHDAFKPDMLKIYPTLVIEGTKLHDMWKSGEYVAKTVQDAVKLIVEIKKIVPKWVRIQRIQRDIPVQLIEGGVVNSNLREIVRTKLDDMGVGCKCIRCREVGHRLLTGEKIEIDDVKLLHIYYNASGGEEAFVSFEDTKKDVLIGYVRLRKPSDKSHRKEIGEKSCAIIRDLKILGAMVPIGEEFDKEVSGLKDGVSLPEKWQHRGYGTMLVKECEKIAKERWGVKRILVNSGVGARSYYRKIGYERCGAYMGKDLQPV
ncbi:MAG: tRNA uridine(34) 5-carboxymethylaminomethyl modification radical SAM/GNAT enzyme Elp3 [Thermoplasmata archaeon]